MMSNGRLLQANETVSLATESRSSELVQSPVSVAIVGPLPPPSGGMANQTRQLARLLQESGARVELVRTNAPYTPRWVSRIRGLRAAFRLIPYMVDLWRCAGRVELVHVMANSGWAWHFFATPAIWIASLRSIPVVVNYRGGEAGEFFARQFWLVKRTLMRAAAVIVPSGFLQELFAQHGVDTEVVPNVIDLARFHPAMRRASADCEILVTRNLEDIYDIPTALRAFAEIRRALPHAHMTVAGSGPRLEHCRSLCRELRIESAVNFTGRVDNEAIAGLYQRADLVLNASLIDNMPISLLEAMASGVPIVTTNVGGIAYLVKDEVTALLVPPRDPQAMAAAALRLLRDPDMSRRMAAQGVAHAAQFTWQQVGPRLLDVYRRARRFSAGRSTT